MVLVIDNYDSFTYNIVQGLMSLGQKVLVYRNDAIDPDKAEELDFDYLVISPGPGSPSTAGCSMEMIRRFAGRKPILGVCLGHQSICEAFGGEIVRAKRLMHGKSDMISHDGKSLFSGMPNPLRVIRYHSLAAEESSLPDELFISARASDGEIMAVRHKTMRVEGVQFHPESIGTEDGMRILSNFLSGVDELPQTKTILRKLRSAENLTFEESSFAMEQLSTGRLSSAQSGAMIAALSVKGETVDEIAGFVTVLRGKALPVSLPEGMHCIDTCGTGGDESGTFNISTTASFVAAGAGCFVAKHGNRSITSRSGSADVLECLGVSVNMPPEKAAEALTTANISFFFAPNYHHAFKYIGPVRRELGFRTVFNMMGPMLNPAGVDSQVIGVFAPELAMTVAMVMKRLGSRRALIVHGCDGLDEITLTGTTSVTELRDGWIRQYAFDPREYGFEYCTAAELKGGGAKDNALIVRSVLSGEKGPRRDVVVLNAAAALIAAGKADDFKTAVSLAQQSIDSGSALRSLDALAAFSGGNR
jgi:anthranilate synthase/phosphoribosyltransferase